ncbi:MAG: DUF6506 family protein [Anaerovoracaceae bacterium]
MLKYAFILNVPGENPQSFSTLYKTADSENLIVATESMEMTEDLVKKLAGEGYTLFNLCGDFDDEMTAKLKASIGADVKMHHAEYFPEEMEKLEKLPNLMEYGIIIEEARADQMVELYIESKECNARMIFAKDMETAKKAAKKLIEKGVMFIELCSYYDEAMTNEIIKSINGAVPIGSCGIRDNA